MLQEFDPTPILKVSLSNIKHNYSVIRDIIGNTSEVAAVVKADAYGLGVEYIAPALFEAGCRKFFVSSLEEAITLDLYICHSQIFILHGIFSKQDIKICKERGFIPVINNLFQLSMCTAENFLGNTSQLDCVLNFNSSINRLGINSYELEEALKEVKKSKIRIMYLMSHLSSGDDKNSPLNLEDLSFVLKIQNKFDNIPTSFSNSAAVLLGEKYYFDLLRVGAALYGIIKYNINAYEIKDVVSLYARVIQVNFVPKNSCIGYNCRHRVPYDASTAIISLGYADGCFRDYFTNKAEVFISGHRAKVIGLVSMDLIIIDTTLVPKEYVFLGQKVEILGDNQNVQDLEKKTGIFGYEFFSRIGNRYKREYN